MRCWECCPDSSTDFCHLFRTCTFTRINSISEIGYSQFHCWYLFSILLMCGGWLQVLPYIKIANPHTLEELKASIRSEIDCISEIKLGPTFPKKMVEICSWRSTAFPTSHLQGTRLFFLVILLNCRPPCSGGIVFDLPPGPGLPAVAIASRRITGALKRKIL